ncbi:MAG TPA: HAMP domain-containing sensor histidine kinase [Gammaproteobacteria bacterium]|nr:HAMP domain-containing sensor histidine kinase [Gammaproteobacteria bacterium]
MAGLSTYIVSFIQIASDVVCVLASARLAKNNEYHKVFFWISCVAFSILTLDDIYYNYVFRILKSDILLSARLVNMMPFLTFQLLQSFGWYYLLRQQKIKIFSQVNLPYLLFSAIAIFVLIHFFVATSSLSVESFSQGIFDILSVSFDMFIWFFTIICLGRSSNRTLALLALSLLMISSSDLTITCLFMVEKDSVAIIQWPHIVWTIGTFLTAIGFMRARNEEKFTFFNSDSIHANCSWWLLMSSLFAFVIGFAFYFFFTGAKKISGIPHAPWDMPISLMLTMIAATLLSNRFSKIMLSQINSFSAAVESFNSGERPEIVINNNINEFRVLGDFIDKSFTRINEQLDSEIKISAQVVHDIRSPLAALEIGIKSLPSSLDESNRLLLRDAVQHIRDITNTLEKNDSFNKPDKNMSSTQLAVLLDNVISDRRLTFNRSVKINQSYGPESYSYFCTVVPATMKRILINVLNNSYEAIGNSDGIIKVNLIEENGCCIIVINDNGGGFSVDTASLFKRGFSTKKSGTGLGLYHAREMLAAWGASIELFSNGNEGAEVKIKIPLIPPPAWFVNQLPLTKNEIIVCIDDSVSVYRGWQERFKEFGYNQKLIYCATKEIFLKKLKYFQHKSATYLIDFEFSGKDYQGYDFVNLLKSFSNIKNKIFMVTSHSDESEIQNYCMNNSIQIIPKNFAVKIPFKIIE